MKSLIEQYLLNQGILIEDYSVQINRFSVSISANTFEFVKWYFNCPKPNFTLEEVKDCMLNEKIDAIDDGINEKFKDDEATRLAKISEMTAEINALATLEEIVNYQFNY